MFDVPARYNFVRMQWCAYPFINSLQWCVHVVLLTCLDQLAQLSGKQCCAWARAHNTGCEVLLCGLSGCRAPHKIRHNRATDHRKSTIPVW